MLGTVHTKLRKPFGITQDAYGFFFTRSLQWKYDIEHSIREAMNHVELFFFTSIQKSN